MMEVEDFGRLLIETGDLDPVYVALNRMRWPGGFAQRDRWLQAYWCCYHVGASCWLAEVPDFWGFMRLAAVNERPSPLGGRWPRAAERRHWRGQAAIDSVNDLERRYGNPNAPDKSWSMVRYCGFDVEREDIHQPKVPLALIEARVKEHTGFGPWIAFKVADMLERCCGVPVEFGNAPMFYDSPKKAALALFKMRAGLPAAAKVKDELGAISQVSAHLLRTIGDLEAPGGGRACGLPEVETVLCKWGSHLSGHYPPGKDIAEIYEGLSEWETVSPLARKFLAAMPVDQAKLLGAAPAAA